ncbi:sensor histidine kinase [Sphingomonas carotinifaciens]|uniref:histidine kinase n=1 Tax=Sphingomonas carotinifaciens TaxID=1166323 RepID=A0A1G7I4S4_9SPHN|nr:stimulus-sensing domain-containing protein [Sphingomonas carotinifaciens]MBB4085011.1 two-component system sensor histidine kinase ChvG [Sphingomonas carotinifaciens]MWC44393.1 HAMP domain-containing protein [Sphingomonas carotinifaciens]SDF07339.1 two-component system, OmpR family, sensor histidine kinase ChvG [Sphingomonas carotinifaciens]
MAPATDSPRSETSDLALRWSGQISLTRRILAVNIFALLLLAGGFFYLDSYRSRIMDSRVAQAGREARLVAEAIGTVVQDQRDRLILRLAADTDTRIRLYDPAGGLVADSRVLGLRNVVLRDPDKQGWRAASARLLDAVIDTVAGATRAPLYREQRDGRGWPDVVAAQARGVIATSVWRAPDRTPVITAAAPVRGGGTVMTTINARGITKTVRSERFRLSVVLGVVTLISVLLSLFLARTIVRPLRRLARAAVRVRLGRAREVVVPRLPDRRDELGMLARALSDMSLALRDRIDATEAFAADVTHELKNPLASLRSAVESLDRIKDPALQQQLLAIVRDDVHRLDRLITDISDASRLDAQLSRAKFEPVDIVALIRALLDQRVARGVERDIRLRLDAVGPADWMVQGEGARLERVFENLNENAISFSPNGGTVAIGVAPDAGTLVVRVEDEGPGVPEEARDAIFRRFHSDRPEGEEFGRHSGLGLAIARTIVEAHQGSIIVESREDRIRGARFVVRMPLAPSR